MAAAPAIQLKQMALEIANNTLGRAKSLEPERLQIQMRLKEIEATLASASLCHERARNFVAQMGRDYQCPRCWILHEAKVSLTPVPSDTKDDRFRCDRCGIGVEIEMGF
jgi:hypothetical protein